MEKEHLVNEKNRIEKEIKKAEKKEFETRLLNVMSKLEEVANAVSNLQHNINHIWKRTEQIKEEIFDLMND